MTPGSVHEAMLQAAIAAPSPDNNQPWLFRISADRLQVYLDQTRSLPSDVLSMFDMTSIGAAVENAVIAASQHGVWAEVVWCGPDKAQSSSDLLVAELHLHRGGEADRLASAIDKRCTCRKMYSSKPLGVELTSELAAACSTFPEVQVDWLRTGREKQHLAKLVASTDALRFQHQPFHEELFRQLRFKPREVEASADGLDVRTLELPPGLSGILRLLGNWKTMQAVIHWKLLPLLTLPSAASVRKSGAIAIVSVPREAVERPADTSKTFFTGGRAIERIWLAGTAAGLSMHPLGSLPIFLLQKSPKPEFEPTIENARAEVHKLVPSLQGRVIQLALRVGYSAPPSRRSLRRAPQEVVLKGSDLVTPQHKDL